jgi:hypothetical protein
MPSTAARAVAKTKRAMMSFSRKGAAPCKSYGEMRERASVPAARRLRSKAFFPHAASALTSARVDLSKYQRPRIASAEMSHGTLFELEAVAQTAQISLAWGITIRQNRGDTTAREPRTYHGRGFSLSASRRDRFDRCYDPCQSRDRSSDVGVRAAARHESKRHRDAAPPRILRIVDVDQNGWASKIDRAWGAFGGIAALEGQNRCAKLRSVLRSQFCSRHPRP